MSNLCPCATCTETYSKLAKHLKAIQSMTAEDRGLQNNLEGNVNEDDEEEKKQEITSPRAMTPNSPQKI